MRRMMMWVAAPLLAAVCAAGAAAQTLPRLPGELRLARSADSPGQVTFDHATHVDSAKPSCTTCHSQDFNILKASARKPITHAQFDQHRQCGKCHDGKNAFAIDADCANCHRS